MLCMVRVNIQLLPHILPHSRVDSITFQLNILQSPFLSNYRTSLFDRVRVILSPEWGKLRPDVLSIKASGCHSLASEEMYDLR